MGSRVIGVNSLVTKSIPSGSLAAGSPAAVIRAGAYPSPLTGTRLVAFWVGFFAQYATLLGWSETSASLPDLGIVRLASPATTYAAVVDEDAWERRGRESALGARRLLVTGPGMAQDAGRDGWTTLDTAVRRIGGVADDTSERLANELRRHGIRFYSRGRDGRYRDWDVPVPVFADAPG
jgi:hypothetical protein